VPRTVDRGHSRQQVAPPDTATLDFRDIQAFDADHAVALSIGPGDGSRIYRTADGGAHWQLTPPQHRRKRVLRLHCLLRSPARPGDVRPVDGAFWLQSMSDGGRSWQPLPADGMPPAPSGEADFAASDQCVTTSDPRDALIATGGGARARVLHSSDGRRHWEATGTPLPSSPSAGVFAVAFRNPWYAVSIGGDFAQPDAPTPAVALSHDRGRTWQAPPEAPAAYRSGLAWTGLSVVAVGPGGSDLSRDGDRHEAGSFDTMSCTCRGDCLAHGRAGYLAR
jgi:photosystem II stability/assembly factor-like uncharacterized protein